MLEFTKLTLDDIDIIKPFLSHSKSMICDNTVGGAFMWRDYFEVEYAISEETLYFKAKVKYHNNVTAFSSPLDGNFRDGVDKIVEYCKTHNLPIIFFNVTGYELEVFHEIFGDFKSKYYEDWSDYLYTASNLTTLSGRKFSGQRNHINYFKSNYNYSFEEINKSNINEVVEFFKSHNSKTNKSTDILSEEYQKTLEVFDNYDTYGMLGGLLRVNGSIIAVTFGEIINHVLFVHIEKADISYRGAYQVMNNEFAKHFCLEDTMFINRAEDNGDEGLKKAKQAYHPCALLNKHIVEIG